MALSKKMEAALNGQVNHYRIIESERAKAQKYDDHDDIFPMMYAGP